MYLGKVVCDIAPGAAEMRDDNYGRDDVSVIISSWRILRSRYYIRRGKEREEGEGSGRNIEKLNLRPDTSISISQLLSAIDSFSLRGTRSFRVAATCRVRTRSFKEFARLSA